jgi:hypothetical protein
VKGIDNVEDEIWMLIRVHDREKQTITEGYYIINYEISTGRILYNQSLPFKDPET